MFHTQHKSLLDYGRSSSHYKNSLCFFLLFIDNSCSHCTSRNSVVQKNRMGSEKSIVFEPGAFHYNPLQGVTFSD